MARQIAQIDAARCTGCGRCISACELRLFAFETQHWKKKSVMQDANLCSGCGECVARCPTGAVSLVDDQPSRTDDGSNEGVAQGPSPACS